MGTIITVTEEQLAKLARGQVFAQFQKWADKGVNPQNGCELRIHKYKRFPIQYQIWRGQACVWSYLSRQKRPIEIWDTAARILRLEKPQAKAIAWTQGATCYTSGEGYIIDCDGGKFHPAYQGGDLAPGCATLEEAQVICQAHKQKRYDKLGGWE